MLTKQIIIQYFLLLFMSNIFADDLICLNDNSKFSGKIIKFTPAKTKIKIQYGVIDVINSNIKDIVLNEEQNINNLIRQKQYQQAIHNYLDLIFKSTNLNKKNILSYKLALVYKDFKQDEKAIKISQDLINSNNFFIFRNNSYFLLYEVYFTQKEFDKAEDILNVLEKDVSLNNEIVAKIVFYKSIIEYNKNNEEKQVKYLSKIVKDYSKTTYKKLAQKSLNKINLQKTIEEELIKIPIEMEKIQNKRWRYSNVRLYDPLIKKCNYIIKKSTNVETLKEAYHCLFSIYLNQAEYKKANIFFEKYLNCAFKKGESVSFFINKTKEYAKDINHNLDLAIRTIIFIKNKFIKNKVNYSLDFLLCDYYTKSSEFDKMIDVYFKLLNHPLSNQRKNIIVYEYLLKTIKHKIKNISNKSELKIMIKKIEKYCTTIKDPYTLSVLKYNLGILSKVNNNKKQSKIYLTEAFKHYHYSEFNQLINLKLESL